MLVYACVITHMIACLHACGCYLYLHTCVDQTVFSEIELSRETPFKLKYLEVSGKSTSEIYKSTIMFRNALRTDKLNMTIVKQCFSTTNVKDAKFFCCCSFVLSYSNS